MITIGSQKRETLSEAGCRVYHRLDEREVLLIAVDADGEDTGHLMLYCANDHYAGHVIDIDGVGYEFCANVKMLLV